MTITQADIDLFNKQGKAATQAVVDSRDATHITLTYHGEYSKALKLRAAALKACEMFYETAQSLFDKAKADGNNYWLKTSAQGVQNTLPTFEELENARKAIFADMAAHAQILFPKGSQPGTQDPGDLATAVDAKNPRTIPKGVTGSGGGSTSLDPTSDEVITPSEDMGTAAKVGLFAAAGVALLWIGRKVLS